MTRVAALLVLLGSLAWMLPARAQETETPRATVTLHDARVFTLHKGYGARSLEERARSASIALTEAALHASPDDVKVVQGKNVVTIMVGTTPIVDLTQEDATLAGVSTLDVLAARIASNVREAVRKEQRRSAIANTVFSISLVVFFGLVTLYLIRQLIEFTTRARTFVLRHPERVPSLQIASLEVLGSAALRGMIQVFLAGGRWLGTLSLVYGWLVISLSLFAQTRPYTERLTGIVISPLSAFVGRLATALPMLVIALLALAALLLLLRFVSLFFASVERREIQLSWLRADLAPATSTLVQIAIVVGSLVFAAPLITGDQEGPLSRIGLIAVLSLGLATSPLLASAAVGLSVIFSRGLSVGDIAEYGGERGRVRLIGLTMLTLEGSDGTIVRVPHLRSLWHPTRLFPSDASRESTPGERS